MVTPTPTAERPWRCFVAVPIGEELRANLAAAVERLRDADPERDAAFRWTDPQGWHVTLAFLGSTPADAVPGIVEAMRGAASGIGPFQVATGGLGAFPSPRRARVMWYRIADPERRLRGVARAVREELGLEDGALFRAHLTLARARAERGTGLDAGLLAAELPVSEITVDRLVLYRSHHSRGPAQYEALSEAPLVAQAAARAAATSPA
jgi:2'-5' RNA ligase